MEYCCLLTYEFVNQSTDKVKKRYKQYSKANFFYVSILHIFISCANQQPNGLRYLRWGRDGEAVQPEK